MNILQNIIKLFNEIRFTEDELKQINNLSNQIQNNIEKLPKMKNKINEFINNIKLIKGNNSIYENNKENNYQS